MYKLIEFLRRTYVVLLFVLIQAIALYVYSGSTSYTRAKILSQTVGLTGGVQGLIADVKSYFGLSSQNEVLARRVAELENELDIYRQQEAAAELAAVTLTLSDEESAEPVRQYEYDVARVISNSINSPHNYITLNKGTAQGITPNMGVVTPDGCMVGYTIACSENYSVVMPMLNVDFRNSGKLEGDNRIGAIVWNGVDPSHVTMNELPDYAQPSVGEEVYGSGLSHYFPVDMKVRIGYVESFTKGRNQTTFDVVVHLATDFASLDYVVLVRNKSFDEVTQLEQSVKQTEKK